MVLYAGQDLFPESYQLADDGVKPTASEVNVGLEALGDRTRWLYQRAIMRVAAFDPMVDNLSASTTHRDGRPGYSLRRQRWQFGTNHAVSTENYGGDMAYSSPFAATTGYHCAFINDKLNARYGNGIFVPVKIGTDAYQYLHASDTYPVTTAMPSADWSGVIHEPVNDLYIAWHLNKLYTSPTSAIAWTSRTLTGGVMGTIPVVHNGAGRMLAHGKVKGVYASSDGATWTECTTAFGLTGITALVWDAWRNRFVVMLSNGAGLSETWQSSDFGATWSMIATNIPLNIVTELVCIGPAMVGMHLASALDPQRVVYSLDGGATWGRAPAAVWAPLDSPAYIGSNGADLLAVNLAANYRNISFSRGHAPILF